jgi:hypothetical protein
MPRVQANVERGDVACSRTAGGKLIVEMLRRESKLRPGSVGHVLTSQRSSVCIASGARP